MKKFSRIIALVLAFVMIAGSAASVFAASSTVATVNWFDGSVDKLFAWGIIDEEDREIAKTQTEVTLDRNVFALWVARILAHEFGAENDNYWRGEYEDEKGTVSDKADFVTGYDDVDDSEKDYFRRAIAYVTANGLFEGYGVDAEGLNKFGPEDATELYQACKVLIALLTRWQDEFNTTYLDDVFKYDEYLGDNTLRSRGTAYLWKSLSLGIVDKTYTKNCTEYFWDAELTYGEAAYLIVKAITAVNPAAHANDPVEDTNGNDCGDLCVAENFTIADRPETYTGIVTVATDANNDGVLDGDITVNVMTGLNKYVEVTFTADEFKYAAVLTDKEVSVDYNDENGYAVNAVVTMEYLGNILILEKNVTTADLTAAELAEVKRGFMNACTDEDPEDLDGDGKLVEDIANTIVVTGNYVYSTYLTYASREQAKLPAGVVDAGFAYDATANTITYKGVTYLVKDKYSVEPEGNEIIVTINGVPATAAEIAANVKNLAEGEMIAVFGDLTADADDAKVFELLDLKDARAFAELDSVINRGSGVAGASNSYIVFDKAMTKPGTNRVFGSKYAKDAGLAIVLAGVELVDGKVPGYYTFTTVYADADCTKEFNAIREAAVTEVGTVANGYVPVTFGEVTVLLPTADTLANGGIAETFYYTVEGAKSSMSIADIKFEELEEIYAAIGNDYTRLVGRYLTVVYNDAKEAIYVTTNSALEAEDVVDAGYVSDFVVDGNTATITLNTVGANGVITHATYKVNLTLSATYGFDVAALVAALDANIVEATPADKIAALSQLIYVGIKDDGIDDGVYVLVDAPEEDIVLNAVDTTTVLAEEKLVKSEISSTVDPTFVPESKTDAEYTFTAELLDKNVNTITNTYTTIVASGYAYQLVDGAYKLVPAEVYSTTKTVVQTLDAKVDFDKTYWMTEVFYNGDNGEPVLATPDSKVEVNYDIVVGGVTVPKHTEITFADLIKYQKETAYDEFYFDKGLEVGMFTDRESARYHILTDAEGNEYVVQLTSMRITDPAKRHVIYETDENGNFAYEEAAPVYGVKEYLTLNGDKYESANGEIVVNVADIHITANIEFTATEMTVAGVADKIAVEGYTVYFVTPSDTAETFEFKNGIAVADLAEKAITAVGYVVDATNKTVTIFGE